MTLILKQKRNVIYNIFYNRRFHTSSALDWMEIFLKDFADTPILVCLTQADRLYEDFCEEDMIPECPKRKIPALKMQFEDELQVL